MRDFRSTIRRVVSSSRSRRYKPLD
jgi:hypothetical protein